jgi:biopolymer transport protein ExbD
MRRFSQRNSLVTLSDINITPLLDLAFVLLIIFVITTPLLEQGLDLSLAKGGRLDRPIQKDDIYTVEISPTGVLTLGTKRMELSQIEKTLVNAHARNPNLLVYIRADENSQNKYLLDLIDRCQRNNITRFSLRTSPDK